MRFFAAFTTSVFVGTLGALSAHAAPKSNVNASAPSWDLRRYFSRVTSEPDELIAEAERHYDRGNLRIASQDPAFAFDWQRRLALVTALSAFFEPDNRRHLTPQRRPRVRRVIETALLEDPSLLVRDGAVESLRRIFRMQPAAARGFQKIMEDAFLKRQNVIDGEGLFIRETLLIALKEGNLPLTNKIRNVALKDKNPEVQSLARSYNETRSSPPLAR